MVTASLRPVDVLLPWLEESGADDDLTDKEKYPNVVALVRDLPHVMDVLKRWVANNDADALFFEAQRRHQPFGAVWDIATAARTPQVEARRYFQPVAVPGAGAQQMPGRLFRTDADGEHPGAPRTIVSSDINWTPRATVQVQGDVPVTRPLEGTRILDFTHVLAGPFGTRVLADLGADVIKVGSTARSGGANSAAHPYYVMWNRNKRSISLNMGTEGGRKVARRLAANCDVVIDNFSAGVLKRWGLDHAMIAEENPRITCISMAGMGNDGPWKDFVTFAPTIHAVTGLTYLTGVPGRHDIGYGFSLTDHLSGLAAAVAALEGVESAARTGRGLAIDLAQYEVGLGLMAPALMDYLANGTNPEPCANRHPFDAWAPHGIYPCRGDDSWIALAVRGEDQWRACASVLGLAHDARFQSHDERVQNQDALDSSLSIATKAWDRYELMSRMQAVGVAAGVVQNAADLTGTDPQLAARDYFGTAETPVLGAYGIDRFPARFDGQRPMHYAGTADVGIHTFDVLNEILGLGDDEIAELMSEGALA
jgi:crotonobetainyl-CoA:carnitine CoA-transferase CaiB-like acyl-CoA transferase